MKEDIQILANMQNAEPAAGDRLRSASWGEVLLAILPFVLVLLAEGLPKLLVTGGMLTYENAAMRLLMIGTIILLVACLLAALILAWRHGWPPWSATWYLFFSIPLLLLAVGLSSWLRQGRFNSTITQEDVMFLWVPLFIAVLLYLVTRLHPLRGLLAALPIIYLLWHPNLEFVPDSIELAIITPSILLICLAIAFVLRRGDWRLGLYAVLVMNLAVGILFAYVGIYHGGTLPFVAPGPNLVEMLRSLIPQYLATSAIVLGPLYAWMFRQVGRSAGRGGVVAYHLVLAGLLLVIMANLAGLVRTMQVNAPSQASNAVAPLIILGLVVYAAGVVWLYRYVLPARAAAVWVQAILLALLPLGIPLIFMLPFITWKWPMSNLYGIPLLWVVPHAVSLSLGLLWLVLSTWVVTREDEASGQMPALKPPVQSPILSR
ncbi:MAG: hypothetical protein ACWGO1_04475 [Anaerolineales bacterium]